MDKKLTIKEIAIMYGISERKVLEKIKQYDGGLIKQGVKTCISENMVKTIFESKNCELMQASFENKFAENVVNQILSSKELIQEAVAEVIKPLLNDIEILKNKLSKLENQKALPKPINNNLDNSININYEWLYPSRLAKYLECKTKWVYDALYQLQMVSLDKFTGSYKITENGNEYLKWYNNSLMIKNVLISDIKRIVNIWKKNSEKLF